MWINFFELEQVLKISSTRIHELSQPLSKTRDSFALWKILPCVTFNSETVFGFGWSCQSFVYRSSDMISAGGGVKFGKLGGYCFFCVCRQFTCRHCWTTSASRWICRFVRQQSVTVFSKFWKHTLINSFNYCLQNISNKIKLQWRKHSVKLVLLFTEINEK